MALKVLMLRKDLKGYNADLEELRKLAAGFEQREKDLEQAIEEADTEEERAAVEEGIEEFETEKDETEKKIGDLERKIEEIEKQIEEIEREQIIPANEPGAEEDPKPEPTNEKRSIEIMDRRNIFSAMPAEQRRAFFANEEVRDFLGKVRKMMETREIYGGGVLIPEIITGLIRENILEYSKLYKHVNVRRVSGTGREIVMGTIPEAVWTDCCGNLNELALTFNDAEVNCWKVGGMFAVCNAVLEDSDIDLAAEIINVIGAAIGLALDKAIIYGTGTRMPLGVVTRLEQTQQPADYPATARPWASLLADHIGSVDSADADFFEDLLTFLANAKGKYSRGGLVHVMNEATYTKLKIKAMSINGAGAMVSAIDGTMPIAGGVIEVLDFIPDGDIISGYFDLYLLAERAGINIEQSREAMFINDRTVFRGTARYDGLPVIAEAFVAININDGAVTATANFAPDTANTDPGGGGDGDSSDNGGTD